MHKNGDQVEAKRKQNLLTLAFSPRYLAEIIFMAAMEQNEVILSEGNGLQSTKLLTDKINAVCYIETVHKDPISRKERLK